VVSFTHGMGDWQHQQSVNVETARGPRKVFLWIIPARTARDAEPEQRDGVGNPVAAAA
jgi:hypothetical protein